VEEQGSPILRATMKDLVQLKDDLKEEKRNSKHWPMCLTATGPTLKTANINSRSPGATPMMNPRFALIDELISSYCSEDHLLD
jgi:hypothetical protein